VALRKRFGTLRLRFDSLEWIKTIASVAIMGVVLRVGSRLLPIMDGGIIQSLLLTLGLVVVGIGVYILAHLVMRSVFISDMVKLVRSVLRFRKN
jgi:hypothetical protein